jgi:hypothetical protein
LSVCGGITKLRLEQLLDFGLVTLSALFGFLGFLCFLDFAAYVCDLVFLRFHAFVDFASMLRGLKAIDGWNGTIM